MGTAEVAFEVVLLEMIACACATEVTSLEVTGGRVNRRAFCTTTIVVVQVPWQPKASKGVRMRNRKLGGGRGKTLINLCSVVLNIK
jgi:hypothetical protein